VAYELAGDERRLTLNDHFRGSFKGGSINQAICLFVRGDQRLNGGRQFGMRDTCARYEFSALLRLEACGFVKKLLQPLHSFGGFHF
jgi:hypothetical protein